MLKPGLPVGLGIVVLFEEIVGNPVETLRLLLIVVLSEHVPFLMKSALTAKLSGIGNLLEGSVLKKQFFPTAEGMYVAA